MTDEAPKKPRFDDSIDDDTPDFIKRLYEARDSGNELAFLKALRDRLVNSLRWAGPRDVAPIAKQILDVQEQIKKLDKTATTEDTGLDEFSRWMLNKQSDRRSVSGH